MPEERWYVQVPFIRHAIRFQGWCTLAKRLPAGVGIWVKLFVYLIRRRTRRLCIAIAHRHLTATPHVGHRLGWFLKRHLTEARGNHCDAEGVAHVLVDDSAKDDLCLRMRCQLHRRRRFMHFEE